MAEPTKATVKALENYGYMQDGSFFVNVTKGKRWEWRGDSFTLEVAVAGGWYPVANHYNSEYADSRRNRDHTWYEFPKRWVWEFSEADVRESYVSAAKAVKERAAAAVG